MATIVNNPNTLGVAATTIAEFTQDAWRVELRRARKGATVYHWVRTTRRHSYKDFPSWWEPSPHLMIGGISVGAGSGFTENPPGTVQWSKAVGLSNTAWAGTYGQYDPIGGHQHLIRKAFTTTPM